MKGWTNEMSEWNSIPYRTNTGYFLICCIIIIIIITQYLCHYRFHCHRCSYDNYFHKLKFYFSIIVFITSYISFPFHFDSKDPIWEVWLPFLLTPNHCPFSVTWEILGFKVLQAENLHVTYACLLFFIEKVMHEEQTSLNVNFKTYSV